MAVAAGSRGRIAALNLDACAVSCAWHTSMQAAEGTCGSVETLAARPIWKDVPAAKMKSSTATTICQVGLGPGMAYLAGTILKATCMCHKILATSATLCNNFCQVRSCLRKDKDAAERPEQDPAAPCVQALPASTPAPARRWTHPLARPSLGLAPGRLNTCPLHRQLMRSVGGKVGPEAGSAAQPAQCKRPRQWQWLTAWAGASLQGPDMGRPVQDAARLAAHQRGPARPW